MEPSNPMADYDVMFSVLTTCHVCRGGFCSWGGGALWYDDLKPANSNTPYLADGVLRLAQYQNIEVCLLETSKAMKKAGKSKISFDHHKGMFGLLAMMKRLAHHYELASYETLSNVKIFFLHAHGMFPEYDACIDSYQRAS